MFWLPAPMINFLSWQFRSIGARSRVRSAPAWSARSDDIGAGRKFWLSGALAMASRGTIGFSTHACASTVRTRSDWRHVLRRRRHAQVVELSLDDVVATIACAIAFDHREFDCTGPTGRRQRGVSSPCFYHPVSVDLVNGDDPSGGIKMDFTPHPTVMISLDALDGSGSPLKVYDQERHAAPKTCEEYERWLPPERARAMLQRVASLNRGVGLDRWIYDASTAAARPSLLERAWAFDMCQVRIAVRSEGMLYGSRMRR